MLNTESYTWFAKLIVAGELLIGVALIIGAFVGIAAFFGAAMNWNSIMAGSASTNGLMLIVAILLVLAWKIAGHIGADHVAALAGRALEQQGRDPNTGPERQAGPCVGVSTGKHK